MGTPSTSLSALREDVRSYLANHEWPAERLAIELSVSYSWLSKFCVGEFENVRFERFERLVQWVAEDRARRGLSEPDKLSA